ncbi:hypothetical protein X350_08270 [Oenococcus oeni S12]|nr:hypothetical protein X350_08270 [Oenococcus oeni S12]
MIKKLTKAKLISMIVILAVAIIIGIFVFVHQASSNGSSLLSNNADADTPKTMVAGSKRIWYVVDVSNGELGYNSNIDQILVSENGRITSYNISNNLYLKNLSNKSTNQIIKIAQKEDQKNFKSEVKEQNESNKQQYDDVTNGAYHSKKLLYFMKKVDNVKYQTMTSKIRNWKLIPDDNGNYITGEEFTFTNFSNSDLEIQYKDGNPLSNANINIRGSETLVLATSIQQDKILGKEYAGWMQADTSSENEAALITRSNVKEVKYDKKGTAGTKVDYSN